MHYCPCSSSIPNCERKKRFLIPGSTATAHGKQKQAQELWYTQFPPQDRQTSFFQMRHNPALHRTKTNYFFFKCMTQWRKEVSAEGKFQIARHFFLDCLLRKPHNSVSQPPAGSRGEWVRSSLTVPGTCAHAHTAPHARGNEN